MSKSEEVGTKDNPLEPKIDIGLDVANPSEDWSGVVFSVEELWDLHKKQLNKSTRDTSYSRNSILPLKQSCHGNIKGYIGREILVSEDYKEILFTRSIFNYLEEIISNFKKKGKKVEIIVPAETFGYFKVVAEMSDAGVTVLPVDEKSLKITTEKSFDGLPEKDSNTIRIFCFHNPVNPTQVIYTQSDVNPLAKKLKAIDVDYVFEDGTLAELYKGSIYDRMSELCRYKLGIRDDKRLFVNNNDIKDIKDYVIPVKALEYEDKDGCEVVNRPGFFCNTKEFEDKTIIARSTGKTLEASDRLSFIYLNERLRKEIELKEEGLPNKDYNTSYRVGGLQTTLMNNKRTIIPYHIQALKEAHENLRRKAELTNFHLYKITGCKNVKPLIKMINQSWQAANTEQMDVTELYELLKDKGILKEKFEKLEYVKIKCGESYEIVDARDQIDDGHKAMNIFFQHCLGIEMIPGSMNLSNSDKVYFRVSLGGAENHNKVTGMFKKFRQFMSGNMSDNITDGKESTKPFKSYNDKLLPDNMIFCSDGSSVKDDIDIGKKTPDSRRLLSPKYLNRPLDGKRKAVDPRINHRSKKPKI